MFYNHLVSNQFFKFFTSFVDFFSMEVGALQTSNTFCIFKDKPTMKIVSVLPVWDITAVGSYTAVGIYSTIYPLSGSWVKGVLAICIYLYQTNGRVLDEIEKIPSLVLFTP